MVARNVVVTIVNQVASWTLSIAVMWKLQQYLGASGLGQFTLAYAIAGICAMVVSLGTSTVLIREIARDHSMADRLIPAAIAMRIPLGFVGLALALLVGVVLGYSHLVMVLIVITVFAMVLAQVNDVFASALVGVEQLPKQNLGLFTERVISSAGTLVLIALHGEPWTLMAISLLSNTIALAVNVHNIKPYITRLAAPDMPTVKMLVREGRPFMSTSLFAAIYGQSDPPILSKLSTEAQIGWYGLGRRLIGTVLFFPVALTNALLPTLARVSREEPESFGPMMRRVIDLVLVAVVPFAALMVFAPAQILRVLKSPESFSGSIPVLMIFGAGTIVWYLSQVIATALIAADRQGMLSRVTGIAALISVPLCIGLTAAAQTHWGNGAVGAAVSDVTVESYLLVSYIRALPRDVIDWRSIGTLARASIAAIPLVLLLSWSLSSTHVSTIVAAGTVGALLYIPLCWLLKCLHPHDIAMVKQMFSKKLAPA
jgi:O-antigen/teichoic acid export membrane protein